MTEPPSGITYKDQALSLQELQARSNPALPPTPTPTHRVPSGIAYKDQALSIQELQARPSRAGDLPPTTRAAVDDSLPLFVTAIPVGDASATAPGPPQQQFHGDTMEYPSAEPTLRPSRRKGWILGGVAVLVVVLAVVAAIIGGVVALRGDDGAAAASVARTDPGDGMTTNAPTPVVVVSTNVPTLSPPAPEASTTSEPTTLASPSLGPLTVWSPQRSDVRGSGFGDTLGVAVALTPDARFWAVGATQNDTSTPQVGYVRVFAQQGQQQLGPIILGEASDLLFGRALDISTDGTGYLGRSVRFVVRKGTGYLHRWDHSWCGRRM
jgi:hypothetical protein